MKSDNSTTHGLSTFPHNFASMYVPDDTCLLCGARRAVIGIFAPTIPEAWGAPKGKQRYFRYCLCSICFKSPDKAEMVEKVIWRMVSGGGVTYAE